MISICTELKTSNTPYEDIFNIFTMDRHSSRLENIKIDDRKIKADIIIDSESISKYSGKINIEIPKVIYLVVEIDEIKHGVRLRYIIPQIYSDYVKGVDTILIYRDGSIFSELNYNVAPKEMKGNFGFRHITYRSAVKTLESFIISIYNDKRNTMFNQERKRCINTYSELLDIIQK